MSLYNLTDKYSKYLGKFENALNRQDHDKLNRYTQKLKVYNCHNLVVH